MAWWRAYRDVANGMNEVDHSNLDNEPQCSSWRRLSLIIILIHCDDNGGARRTHWANRFVLLFLGLSRLGACTTRSEEDDIASIVTRQT